MKRKKWTPEEGWPPGRAAREARLLELSTHMARIETELAAKKKPA